MRHSPISHRMIRRLLPPRSAHTNATIMPASLLPFKAQYSQIANQLPTGSVLILTPPLVFSKQRNTLAKVAVILRSTGHKVKTLPFA
jgi:hypothetical protein